MGCNSFNKVRKAYHVLCCCLGFGIGCLIYFKQQIGESLNLKFTKKSLGM